MRCHPCIDTVLFLLTLSATFAFNLRPNTALQRREPTPGIFDYFWVKDKAEPASTSASGLERASGSERTSSTERAPGSQPASALSASYPVRLANQRLTDDGKPWFIGVLILDQTKTEILLVKRDEIWRLPQVALPANDGVTIQQVVTDEAWRTAGIQADPTQLGFVGKGPVGQYYNSYYQVVSPETPVERQTSGTSETKWVTRDQAIRILNRFSQQLRMVKSSELAKKKPGT